MAFVSVIVFAAASVFSATPQETTCTYQGRLTDAGNRSAGISTFHEDFHGASRLFAVDLQRNAHKLFANFQIFVASAGPAVGEPEFSQYRTRGGMNFAVNHIAELCGVKIGLQRLVIIDNLLAVVNARGACPSHSLAFDCRIAAQETLIDTSGKLGCVISQARLSGQVSVPPKDAASPFQEAGCSRLRL
jgi:hypothetical protein